MNFNVRDTTRVRVKSPNGVWGWFYQFIYDTDDMKCCVADLTVVSEQLPSKDEVKKVVLNNYQIRVADRDLQELKRLAEQEIKDAFSFQFEV